jgi:flagellar biosynthesis protein FlhB
LSIQKLSKILNLSFFKNIFKAFSVKDGAITISKNISFNFKAKFSSTSELKAIIHQNGEILSTSNAFQNASKEFSQSATQQGVACFTITQADFSYSFTNENAKSASIILL